MSQMSGGVNGSLLGRVHACVCFPAVAGEKSFGSCNEALLGLTTPCFLQRFPQRFPQHFPRRFFVESCGACYQGFSSARCRFLVLVEISFAVHKTSFELRVTSSRCFFSELSTSFFPR